MIQPNYCEITIPKVVLDWIAEGVTREEILAILDRMQNRPPHLYDRYSYSDSTIGSVLGSHLKPFMESFSPIDRAFGSHLKPFMESFSPSQSFLPPLLDYVQDQDLSFSHDRALDSTFFSPLNISSLGETSDGMRSNEPEPFHDLINISSSPINIEPKITFAGPDARTANLNYSNDNHVKDSETMIPTSSDHTKEAISEALQSEDQNAFDNHVKDSEIMIPISFDHSKEVIFEALQSEGPSVPMTPYIWNLEDKNNYFESNLIESFGSSADLIESFESRVKESEEGSDFNSIMDEYVIIKGFNDIESYSIQNKQSHNTVYIFNEQFFEDMDNKVYKVYIHDPLGLNILFFDGFSSIKTESNHGNQHLMMSNMQGEFVLDLYYPVSQDNFLLCIS